MSLGDDGVPTPTTRMGVSLEPVTKELSNGGISDHPDCPPDDRCKPE